MTDEAGKDGARGNSATEIVSRGGECTLEDICVACKVDADWVAELVEHGALDPTGQSPSEWRFTQISVVHVAKAKRLERDLGLNTPGIALAFDLINQIEDLRRRLTIYETSR
jgi:chaperone modulatory protein CbpM